MAKTRISISLDRDHAERIKAHAERAGMDVSAYLVNAATRQMAEAEAIEAQFAGIDRAIAEAEAGAGVLPVASDVTDEDLTEAERREVREAMELIYGAEGQVTRPGDAA